MNNTDCNFANEEFANFGSGPTFGQAYDPNLGQYFAYIAGGLPYPDEITLFYPDFVDGRSLRTSRNNSASTFHWMFGEIATIVITGGNVNGSLPVNGSTEFWDVNERKSIRGPYLPYPLENHCMLVFNE